MRLNLLTQYPLWLFLVCITTALLYSVFLYRKDRHFKEVKRWIIHIMAIIRFIIVFFLCFFLLSPLISGEIERIEKPLIIFAQDNSESLLLNKDSAFYKNEYNNNISSFLSEFNNDIDIESYSFGEKLSGNSIFNFSEKTSNISGLLSDIENLYINRNVGSIIIASDGIYNTGQNPLYYKLKLNCPVYTVALGDTIFPRDLFISKIETNKIAFTGNPFPIRVRINAYGLMGQTSSLNISNNGEVIYSQIINIDNNNFVKWIPIDITSENTGVAHYTISLDPLNEEININNNKKEFVIEFIDTKQKILIIPFSPHPDIAAIKTALKMNQKFEVDIGDPLSANDSLNNYNLIILHQLPAQTNSSSILFRKLSTLEIPVLYILGSQTSMTNINNLNIGINISSNISSLEEVRPLLNSNFSLFKIDEEFTSFIDHLPPLLVHFGEYNFNSESEVLFFQKIKQIDTERPLLIFNHYNTKNDGFILGEGLWRWRMYDYLENGNFIFFDGLMNKIVQYLSIQVKDERFIINVDRIIPENEAVLFNAELYNESYENINHPELKLEIRNLKNEEFTYIFDRTGDTYSLNIGTFPYGDYKYIANVDIADESLIKEGEFSIIKMDIESENTIADHGLLYQLAENNGGKMFSPLQFAQLKLEIENNPNINTQSWKEKQYFDLINFKWILFIFVFLLSMEWFLRKFFGSV
ncbi:hypothetical protein ACFLSY_09010 [Bacteroidota bacterium]